MTARAIKKAVAVAAMFFLALACAVPDVFAWGSATHAYIDDHLGMGKKQPLRNMNEIYGGMAPDVFNYMFEHVTDWYPYLYEQTHYVKFTAVWEKACSRLGESEAYGFVSHNNVWGADRTAHGFPGAEKGYVIEKAEALLAMTKPPGLPPLEDLFGGTVALELYHNVVEAAVDILVAQKMDRMIGNKMASAAILRSPEFHLLLVKVYANTFAETFGMTSSDAVREIVRSEKDFRKIVVIYGQALMQDENTAIQLVSEQLADMAVNFLAGYGLTIPDDLKNQLPTLTNAYITLAMSVCEADYRSEIVTTIDFVNKQLGVSGIHY